MRLQATASVFAALVGDEMSRRATELNCIAVEERVLEPQ
jgi:hypothetical protein